MRALVLTVGTAYMLFGQERIELTATAWRIHTTGTIQSGIVPVDLQSDLALADRFAFTGRLLAFPGRRHGVVLEGSSLTPAGDNNLARTIVYNGRTYNVRDQILSNAELNTIYAGYQYSVLSNRRGRLAFGGGGAYISANGTIQSATTGLQTSREYRVGLPLAAMDGGVFLLPGRNLLEIAGDLKGMSFGRYGRYIEGGIHGGLNFGPVGVRIGYRLLDADIHEGSGASDIGVAPRIAGPAFSVIVRL